MAINNPHPPFWRFLGGWLNDRGWTQVKLADELGVHQTVVSKWLHSDPRRRTRPGRRAVAALVRILEIPMADLLGMFVADEAEAEQARASRAAQPVFADGQPDEAEVSASKFVGALRGVPRQFWASVVDASVALANAYAEVTGSAEGPVSTTPVPPVSTSRRPTNKRSGDSGPDLANSHAPALALIGLR